MKKIEPKKKPKKTGSTSKPKKSELTIHKDISYNLDTPKNDPPAEEPKGQGE